MFRACCFACCLVLSLPALNAFTQQDSDVNVRIVELAWLTGSWTGGEGGMQTEEHWIAPQGGMMLGVNRTTRGTKGTFEFLRIQQKGNSLSYFASPGGRPPVEFKLKELSGKTVVFENPDHDFPQRIRYQRQDDQLSVKIEGEDQGQIRSTSWTWQRSGK